MYKIWRISNLSKKKTTVFCYSKKKLNKKHTSLKSENSVEQNSKGELVTSPLEKNFD